MVGCALVLSISLSCSTKRSVNAIATCSRRQTRLSACANPRLPSSPVSKSLSMTVRMKNSTSVQGRVVRSPTCIPPKHLTKRDVQGGRTDRLREEAVERRTRQRPSSSCYSIHLNMSGELSSVATFSPQLGSRLSLVPSTELWPAVWTSKKRATKWTS